MNLYEYVWLHFQIGKSRLVARMMPMARFAFAFVHQVLFALVFVEDNRMELDTEERRKAS